MLRTRHRCRFSDRGATSPRTANSSGRLTTPALPYGGHTLCRFHLFAPALVPRRQCIDRHGHQPLERPRQRMDVHRRRCRRPAGRLGRFLCRIRVELLQRRHLAQKRKRKLGEIKILGRVKAPRVVGASIDSFCIYLSIRHERENRRDWNSAKCGLCVRQAGTCVQRYTRP